MIIFRHLEETEYEFLKSKLHDIRFSPYTNTNCVYFDHVSISDFRFLDVADMIPQLNPGGTGRILKPEFRNALNKMLFHMDDDEFEKLWLK